MKLSVRLSTILFVILLFSADARLHAIPRINNNLENKNTQSSLTAMNEALEREEKRNERHLQIAESNLTLNTVQAGVAVVGLGYLVVALAAYLFKGNG